MNPSEGVDPQDIDWTKNFYTVEVGRDTFQIDRRYTELRPIGAGAYGYVCSAHDQVTNSSVAIKKVSNCFRDLVDAKRILREVKSLRHFGTHPNITTLIDIMTVPPYSVDFRDIYIVTNLMESDLERIITSGQVLGDQHFKYFLYQILRGLKFIHSVNVLHRDLKPSNILVNANCDLNICDFGLSRAIEACDEAQDIGLTEYVVTRWYRSPELLLGAAQYGQEVDIWSVGCIMAEMMNRVALFRGKNPLDQLKRILVHLGCPSEEDMQFLDPDSRAEISRFGRKQQPPQPLSTYLPNSIDPQAVDLLSRMLVFNPQQRISVEEALHHPYLEEFGGMFDEPVCTTPLDFEFERLAMDARGAIPKAQVQALLYNEMLHYRPLSGLEDWSNRSENALAPPLSTSMEGKIDPKESPHLKTVEDEPLNLGVDEDSDAEFHDAEG
uniref:Mitogen-activated protein kinase n=1 Tax=Fibrocapsa japonica TaxID=94617 RepID=A0A7S2UX76_9STRA|mmetsp:Transcript_1481/g.2050  ORF Transcript_1481/g.2050 Transcript_1481/m.2050 type:complete len:439 (+) Transcript_1481:139-1455(+)|eukprot:CAMPEP_0113933878 /NCGR_PEP_ID=MMETSP1339-20121228/1205_1 /TAXON_ID=94617 /ORGANISM="Fibrocapsa japonica" /LENGTH=438 /DNA_ID=CAMNT_0000935393 /DNA_START=31 /DNA_END=1347 /DNA_ORIENTATION=- /assembly_acc=CAM_ASM_000762